MKQIEPVQVWKDGENKTATHIDLKIIHDDLSTTATLYYQLKAETITGETSSFESVADGNHTIFGEEYEAWGESGDINAETYLIVAEALNLEII